MNCRDNASEKERNAALKGGLEWEAYAMERAGRWGVYRTKSRGNSTREFILREEGFEG